MGARLRIALGRKEMFILEKLKKRCRENRNSKTQIKIAMDLENNCQVKQFFPGSSVLGLLPFSDMG